MGKINHLSHGLGDHVTGHSVPGNLARDGAPKRVHAVEVNPGMRATPKSGGDALSGHHASAIDALSGATVVPGAVNSMPGFGNAGIQPGHPLSKLPMAKRLTGTQAAFKMKTGDGDACADLHELGAAVLAEAAFGHRGKKC